jgi:hypothetical protein
MATPSLWKVPAAQSAARHCWEGIRQDSIFVPNTFGPMQKLAEELGTPKYEPANTLVSDSYYDNLSGQQAYKCFACRIKKG